MLFNAKFTEVKQRHVVMDHEQCYEKHVFPDRLPFVLFLLTLIQPFSSPPIAVVLDCFSHLQDVRGQNYRWKNCERRNKRIVINQQAHD